MKIPDLITLLLLVMLFAVPASGADSINSAGLQRMQKDGNLLLVDVRSSQVYARKHIEGAINIPAFVINRKGLSRDDRIVLYDNGIGTMEARSAAEKLLASGYSRVSVLEGGIARWEASGLPIKAQMGVIDTRLVEPVTVTEFAQAVKDGFQMTIVDLRDPVSFKAGTIPGAVNAPADSISRISASWDKDKPLVIFGDLDGLPERQGELLRRAGFKIIRFLYGGYPEWTKQNAS